MNTVEDWPEDKLRCLFVIIKSGGGEVSGEWRTAPEEAGRGMMGTRPGYSASGL